MLSRKTKLALAMGMLLCFTITALGCSAPGQAPAQSGSRWGVMVDNGVHWLRTPEGKPFYSKGVNTINGGKRDARRQANQAFYWGRYFASLQQWRAHTRARLIDWGFNTRGAWSDISPEFELPLMVELDLGRLSGILWDDPFDPKKPAVTLQHALTLTAVYRKDPRLIGYFTDNEVGWWNAPLFRWYLRKGWENHTKRRLWRVLYKQYQGRWDLLLEDWIPQGSLASFAQLKRAGAELKLRPGSHGIGVVNRFTFLCARRYYELVNQAIRQAHPGALILGDRLPLYYHQDAVRAMADQVDVISTNYNVDTADGWVAPYYFEGLQRLADKPVLVSEFFFAADENRSGNRNVGHLMSVATQAERARGAANAICHFARFPNVVGAHWFQYADEPTGGRDDGEDYNMGLVDIANRPYEGVTEVFRSLNGQLDQVHRLGVARPLDKARIARAHRLIDIGDNSMTDWDKASTRIAGFATPKPHVPFADVHLAWRAQGLYVAILGSNYMELDLLSFDRRFPLAETFQLHVIVEDEEHGHHHYAIHLIPKPSPRHSRGVDKRADVEPRIYRYVDRRPVQRMPSKAHVQALDKPLPHIALESFLPAQWLGFNRLEPGQALRLNVGLVKFYRELTMSFSDRGEPEPMADSHAFRTFVLQDSKARHAYPTRSALIDSACHLGQLHEI